MPAALNGIVYSISATTASGGALATASKASSVGGSTGIVGATKNSACDGEVERAALRLVGRHRPHNCRDRSDPSCVLEASIALVLFEQLIDAHNPAIVQTTDLRLRFTAQVQKGGCFVVPDWPLPDPLEAQPYACEDRQDHDDA